MTPEPAPSSALMPSPVTSSAVALYNVIIRDTLYITSLPETPCTSLTARVIPSIPSVYPHTFTNRPVSDVWRGSYKTQRDIIKKWCPQGINSYIMKTLVFCPYFIMWRGLVKPRFHVCRLNSFTGSVNTCSDIKSAKSRENFPTQ